MKQKRLFVVFSILCGFILQAHAQKQFNVKSKSGVKSSFTISTIKNLTFSSGNIVVNKKDATSSTFIISTIQNMNFANEILSDVKEIYDIEKFVFSFYPNPVQTELYFQYSTLNSEYVLLRIVNLQGQVVFQRRYTSQVGANLNSINVSDLKQGLYMCLLHKGNVHFTTKFLKN